jgi:hypothetical protein
MSATVFGVMTMPRQPRLESSRRSRGKSAAEVGGTQDRNTPRPVDSERIWAGPSSGRKDEVEQISIVSEVYECAT